MKRKVVLFLTGSIGYCSLELLSRGFTHWSMGLTGGICLLALDLLWQRFSHKGLLTKSVMGAGIITLAELSAGLIVNVWLGLGVWSYAAEPYNFMGQICLRYSITWFFLCMVIMAVFDFAHFANIVPVSKKREE